jgi:hypothetical protein
MPSVTLEPELRARILADIAAFGGQLPERNAIAWGAYLAALIEWGIIPPDVHRRLVQLLPAAEDDPSVAILLGRE